MVDRERKETCHEVGGAPGARAATVVLAALLLACGGGGGDLTAPAPAGPAKLAVVAGDGQTAPAGSTVATAPAVKVTDANGNAVAGVPVTFAVTGGGGSVTPTTPVSTDATGVAPASAWTLGADPGPNTLTATIPGSGIAGNPARFTATGAPAPTVATDLGPVVGTSGCTFDVLNGYYYSTAYDVNRDAVVAGETGCVAGETLTFRWSQATGMQQLANFPGGYGTRGGKINDAGNIAAVYSTNNTLLDARPIIWTPANTRIDLATPACYPGPDSCSAAPPGDINAADEVVGPGGGPISGPWRWTSAGGLVLLTALGTASPMAVNAKGDIAASTSAGTTILTAGGETITIPGLQPQDMNDQRLVVGATGTYPATTAAIWSDSGGVHGLGTLGGSTSVAYGINQRGEVVGSSTTSNGEVHAFYWNGTRGMVDLGPGIAYAISDRGDMVGTAPSGLFPGDIAPNELWQATLWRGTGGVPKAPMTARVTVVPTGRTAACLADGANWQSRTRMFRCFVQGAAIR
jgi:probable HAF family extracellular repeat protein